MFDVICVGSATVDLFAETKYSELIKIVDNKGEEDLLAYPVGAKILLDDIHFTTGGGGTNVACSLSKLGNKVAYLGCVGETNSENILSDLKKAAVNTQFVVKKNGHSGYSIILDSIEHDRTILAYKGVNNQLDIKDIDLKKIKTKWFYFSAMLEKSWLTLEKIAKFAEKNKIKIAFNPSSYLAEQGSDFLHEVLSRTSVLILNKEEAALIVGKGEIDHLLLGLNNLGPEYVVITDGKNGAYCYHKNEVFYAKANKIKVVETTGAGDAFASSFLAGIILKEDVSHAMKVATTNAESIISGKGAKNNLLSMLDVNKRLKKQPVTVTKRKLVVAKINH